MVGLDVADDGNVLRGHECNGSIQDGQNLTGGEIRCECGFGQAHEALELLKRCVRLSASDRDRLPAPAASDRRQGAVHRFTAAPDQEPLDAVLAELRATPWLDAHAADSERAG